MQQEKQHLCLLIIILWLIPRKMHVCSSRSHQTADLATSVQNHYPSIIAHIQGRNAIILGI